MGLGEGLVAAGDLIEALAAQRHRARDERPQPRRGEDVGEEGGIGEEPEHAREAEEASRWRSRACCCGRIG